MQLQNKNDKDFNSKSNVHKANQSKESSQNLNNNSDNKQKVYTKVIPAQNDRYKKSRSKDLNITNTSNNNESFENNKNQNDKNINMVSIRLDEVKDVFKEFNPMDLNNYQDGIIEKVYLTTIENNNINENKNKKGNILLKSNTSFELNYDNEAETRITGKFVYPNETAKDDKFDDIKIKSKTNENIFDKNDQKHDEKTSNNINDHSKPSLVVENIKKIISKEKVSSNNNNNSSTNTEEIKKNGEDKNGNTSLNYEKEKDENISKNQKDSKVENKDKDKNGQVSSGKNPFIEEEKKVNNENSNDTSNSEDDKNKNKKKNSGNCNCYIF